MADGTSGVSGETILSVTALTLSVFGFFAPPVREARQAGPDDANTVDLTKSGVTMAAALVLGTTAAASVFSRDWDRFFVAAIAVALIAAIYFYQLGDENDGIPALTGLRRAAS